MSRLVVRYEVVEWQHVHSSSKPHVDLAGGLVRLYVAILRYLIFVYHYFGAGRFHRSVLAIFPKQTPEDLMETVRIADEEVHKILAPLNLSISTGKLDLNVFQSGSYLQQE